MGDLITHALAVVAGIMFGLMWATPSQQQDSAQKAARIDGDQEAERRAQAYLAELKALRGQHKRVGAITADLRVRAQRILTEIREAQTQGRPVSAKRIRREVKAMLRWYQDGKG